VERITSASSSLREFHRHGLTRRAHSVGDHHVRPAVEHRQCLGQPLAELDLLQPELCRRLTGLGQHLLGHVDADDPTGRTGLPGSRHRVEPCAGPDVDHALAWLQGAQEQRVPDAGERLHCGVRESVDDLGRIVEAGDQLATGVEVVGVLGFGGDGAVLLPDLLAQRARIHQLTSHRRHLRGIIKQSFEDRDPGRSCQVFV